MAESKEMECPKLEITNKPKENYSSMEKYVLSKLEMAESAIKDLLSENECLNKKLAEEKKKLTVQELKKLKDQFQDYIRKQDQIYFQEHNESKPFYCRDILEDFVNWLELGGYEIYVK